MLAVALTLPLSFAGCASTGESAYTPTIDTRDVSQSQYASDKADCEAYAKANPNADASKSAKKGALTMGLGTLAVVGIATVATGGLALIPMLAGGMAVSGGVAAASGGALGADAANARYKSMMQACLSGRGYKVID